MSVSLKTGETWITGIPSNSIGTVAITKSCFSSLISDNLDAEKKAQEKANQAGEQYEESKEVERVKTEVITREVQKIVERPVYIHTNCFDDDGVSAVNAAGNTSKP